MTTNQAVAITARKKRDGRIVTGTATNDGLQDMWAVTTPDGEVEYITVLDEIIEFTPRAKEEM